MAIVQEKQELLDAALEEIVKLPIDQQHEEDIVGDITYLLTAQRDIQVLSSDQKRNYCAS